MTGNRNKQINKTTKPKQTSKNQCSQVDPERSVDDYDVPVTATFTGQVACENQLNQLEGTQINLEALPRALYEVADGGI